MEASRVERRIQDFKARVTSAAVRLFAEHGIEATKIDDICAEADVAKRTLCHHFPTKAELVDAGMSLGVSTMVAWVDAARRKGNSTRERLSLLFDALQSLGEVVASEGEIGVASIHPDFVLALVQGGTSRQDSAKQNARVYDAIRELLAEGRPQELPRNCSIETFADIVLGALCTAALVGACRDDYDSARHIAMSRDFLSGLLEERRDD